MPKTDTIITQIGIRSSKALTSRLNTSLLLDIDSVVFLLLLFFIDYHYEITVK